MSKELDDIYLKAFNQAYLLSKYNSDLIDKVLMRKNEGRYFEGLIDGKIAYSKERVNTRIIETQALKSRSKNDLDLER